MRWITWIAAATLGLGVLLFVVKTAPLFPAEVSCTEAYLPESERAFCEAHANTERVVRDAKFRHAMEMAKLDNQIMVLRYGEAVADEFFRCTTQPPKHKANQERCKKLTARVQRDNAEAEAREELNRDNW